MKKEREMIRDWILLGLISILLVGLLSIFPDKKEVVLSTSWEFFIEMVWILPAVMVILGLFAVWVPKDIVVKYLGSTSGMKGILFAIVLGTLPTGPLYIAFPIAATLLKKGAKISNIIVFLSSWACIKLPQEMVELQFLGLKFMAIRLILTIIFVVIMGVFIEKLIEWSNKK
ncbi:permease [Thermococcus argininiproducens]|uniref:Permease n=1 Tax=Thermococcus argininiproducens TaxID=2866384 RepID=A0A9E7M8V5_9EURY|nr:permease [Thermococcus argininiproducens]USG99240.1 permease [Thermococcus argininiproducens]